MVVIKQEPKGQEQKEQERKPLEGVRVVDFGWRAVAPLAARMLGWGGAEVIRVESATRHDGARQTPPIVPGAAKDSFNASAWWNVQNSNKLSISLNLKHPEGRELALRLVSVSDIVVENFAAGVMDRLGLGYETLRQYKPDIIMASHSITGLTGSWNYVKGHGPMAAAMAGMNYLSGYEDTPPIPPGAAYTDYVVVPHHSAYALLTALHYRRRTGKGQYIDLAQYETIAHTTGPWVLEYIVNGRVVPRTGNRDPWTVPQGCYPCLPITHNDEEYDHWCVISVATDEEWRSLCKVMGRPELADDPRYASFAARKEREDEIDQFISAWTTDKDAHDVMRCLQAAGVAAGVVQNPKDLLEADPHLKGRGFYHKVHHAEAGNSHYSGPPFTMSEHRLDVRPAPLLGEHNDYVFREILRLSDEEIREAYAKGYVA